MQKIKEFFSIAGGVRAAVAQADKETIELLGDVRYRNKIKPRNRVLECKTGEEEDAAVLAGADIRNVYRSTLGTEFDIKYADVIPGKLHIEVFVPEDLDLNDFRQWWPNRPKDLNTPVNVGGVTDGGRSTESLIGHTDHIIGSDTTALLPVMGMLPVLALIAAVGSSIPVIGTPIAGLSLLGVLMCLYLIYSSEKMGRTMVCAALAAGVAYGGKAMEAIDLSGGTSALEMLSMLVSIFGAALIALPVVMGFGDTGNDGGSFWERYFASLKRVIQAGSAVLITSAIFTLPIFPDFFAIIPWIMLACAYPMFYGQSEFRDTARTRARKSAVTAKPEAQSAKIALEKQTETAVIDKSPWLFYGTSSGTLADMLYKFGYSKSIDVGATLEDNRTHTMLYGQPGSGKTVFLRNIIYQICILGDRVVGILMNDGKGVLANECREMLDVVLEAKGVPFGPFEGLGVIEVVKATVESRGATAASDDSLWSNGANTHIARGAIMLRAVVDQEITTMEAAQRRLEKVQTQLIHLLLKDRKELLVNGANDPAITDEILKLRASFNMYAEWSAHQRQWEWTPFHLDKILTMLGQVKFVRVEGSAEPVGSITDDVAALLKSHLGWSKDPADMQLRLENFPESIHPRTLVHSDLKTALKYFVVEWPVKDEKHRSSFELQVQSDMSMFMDHGDLLVDENGKSWNRTEKGFDVTQVCQGMKLGIYLPKSKFETTGRLYQRLVKQKVYKAIYARAEHGNHWMTEMPGQTLMVDICDECQEIIGDLEIQALPMTRSLGMFGIFATQQFEEFVKTYGDISRAKVLANTFGTQISFMTSKDTFDYLQGMMGEMKYRYVKNEQYNNVPLSQFTEAYYGSVYTDDEHPNAAYFGKLRHQGAAHPYTMSELHEMQNVGSIHKRFGLNSAKGFRSAGGQYGRMKHSITIDDMPEFKEGPVLNSVVWNENLAVQGRAFIMVKRAGVRRADYIDIPYTPERELNAKFSAIKKQWALEKKETVDA